MPGFTAIVDFLEIGHSNSIPGLRALILMTFFKSSVSCPKTVKLIIKQISKNNFLISCFSLILIINDYSVECKVFCMNANVGGMKSCRLRAISYQVTQKLKRATTLE